MNPFVFQRADGRPLSRQMISMAMTRACKNAKINENAARKKDWTTEERADFLSKRFTFHGFRKCVAKRWAERSANRLAPYSP